MNTDLNTSIRRDAPGYQLESIQATDEQNRDIATLKSLVEELTEKLRVLSLATEFDGVWDAVANQPALLASAPIAKGKFKLVKVPNETRQILSSITGTQILLQENAYLISGGPGDKYYYQPPSTSVAIPADESVTLSKLQADLRNLLSQLASMYVDFEDYLHVDAVIDENGLSPWSIDLQGNVLHKGKDVLQIATDAEAMRPLVTELQAGFTKLAPLLAAQVEFPDETHTDAIVDETGLNPWAIDKDGNVLHKGKNVLAIAQSALELKPTVETLQTTFNSIKTQVSQIIATQVELPDVDGYVDAIIDENYKSAWAIDDEGNVLHKGIDVLAFIKQVSKALADLTPQVNQVLASFVEYPDELRFVAGDADENGLAPLLYDQHGNPFFKNRHILKELDDLKAQMGSNPELNKYLFPSKDIVCDGDSLTAATYPAQLQAMYGNTRTVYNRGVGGDTSTQIAFRVGARSVGLTFPNNQIPATTDPVSVTPSNLEIIQKGRNVVVPGKVAGVAGSLTRDANGNYFFTRAAAGAVVITDALMMFNPDGYAGDEFRTTIICLGRNNYLSPDVVLSDVAAIVAYLKTLNKRFLILPVLNGNYSNEFKGGSGYNVIMNLNKTLRETYPRNFADHRQALIRAYDPTKPQDVIDVQNDTVPLSLRVDDIHLTNAGYGIKAQVVKNFLDANNW